ncbi:coiled-coil domain-containing protein 84 [Clupea harengus]|uniref:Coiled-coil domain-containing protein 84 n=1 Tax=Clupea harengus TaxID=7950 RepID=A0A6P3VPD9_CLUHA|nr:coiled-coil domain-containing protein 84 [Clupea harengus]
MVAFYCAVCRQSDFSGKGHIFGKSHQAKLKVVLVKFLEKVKEARRTIKIPQVEKYSSTEHQCNFWCYCCALEVPKHVTNGNLTVLFGGLLEHMSTREHRTSTHKFWWENKADPKLRDKCIIPSEEVDRFKEEVAKALENFEEKEDVHIKEQAAVIRAQEQHRFDVLHSVIECDPELEQSAEQAQQDSEILGGSHLRSQGQEDQPGPSWVDPVVKRRWSGTENGLTFIGYQDSSSSGNVHTGAIPPWMQEDPQETTVQDIGPSLQDFLKQKEQEKLKKLPPDRVGANFDHSSHTDPNWLPSFGRVWNNGRRWQSRHQFHEEEGKTGRRKRKSGLRGKGGKRARKLNHTVSDT